MGQRASRAPPPPASRASPPPSSSTVQRCGGGLLRGPLRPTAARDATEHAALADAALQRLPMRHQHQTWRQQLEFHVNVTQKQVQTPGGGGGV